jgi:hypothetical protein
MSKTPAAPFNVMAGVVAGSAATIGVLEEARGPAWLAKLGLPHLPGWT